MREMGGIGMELDHVSKVMGSAKSYVQPVASRDKLHLLNERKRRRCRGFEGLQVGHQSRGILDGLLPQRLQPLAAHIAVGGRCDEDKDYEDNDEARFAEA